MRFVARDGDDGGRGSGGGQYLCMVTVYLNTGWVENILVGSGRSD